MSSFDAQHLDFDSQNLLQILIDKMVYIKESKTFSNEIDIFTKACEQCGINFQEYYREDISNIFMYSCQIILNENICLVSSYGKSKEKAFENAVKNFILFSCNQSNQNLSPYTDLDSSSITELKESVHNMDVITEFIDKCKNHLQRNPSSNNRNSYESIKKLMALNDPNAIISESYLSVDNRVICSIYLNGILLLQQGKGESHSEALDNSIEEFFCSYEINPPLSLPNPVEVVPKNKSLIIFDVARKFTEQKSNSQNHWVTIQNCIKDLNFKLDFKQTNMFHSVMINDVEILQNYEENEYCAHIKNCRDLIELFNKISTKQDLFTSRIRRVVKGVCNILNTNDISTVWPILNAQFVKSHLDLKLDYNRNANGYVCIFYVDGIEIASGEADNKLGSREAAAKNLISYQFS